MTTLETKPGFIPDTIAARAFIEGVHAGKAAAAGDDAHKVITDYFSLDDRANHSAIKAQIVKSILFMGLSKIAQEVADEPAPKLFAVQTDPNVTLRNRRP